MTREEIIQLIKDNLVVKIKHRNNRLESLEVVLEFCGEEISSDMVYLD